MDDLDRINALIDARGWEDNYVVELLLEFVSARKLYADLLAFLRRGAEAEDAAGIGTSKASKFKTVTLPTGEHLTYWRSEGGTRTVDVKFAKDDPVVASATSGAYEDALLTLATRFKMLGIELENLASTKP